MAVCEEGELKPVIGLLKGEDRYLTAGDNTEGNSRVSVTFDMVSYSYKFEWEIVLILLLCSWGKCVFPFGKVPSHVAVPCDVITSNKYFAF